MALYTKFSVQRALLLKVEDLEVLEGLQSHLGSYVKAQSSGSLYRPISTEGFKSLNRLEGWSAFAQISLFKTTTLFSSATGNTYILSTCLMPQDFFSCQPHKALSSGWGSGSLAGKLENISLGSTGAISQQTPTSSWTSPVKVDSKGGQPLEQVPACPYLSNAMFLISPSGTTDTWVLPWKVDQTEPCLRKTLTRVSPAPSNPCEAFLGTG